MANTFEAFFKASLKRAIAEGYDHTKIDHLAGCTERKLVLTEAEGEAGNQDFELHGILLRLNISIHVQVGNGAVGHVG